MLGKAPGAIWFKSFVTAKVVGYDGQKVVIRPVNNTVQRAKLEKSFVAQRLVPAI
jgi:hypothetical protein